MSDASKLRHLADWLDIYDGSIGRTGSEVQDDLRRIAGEIEQHAEQSREIEQKDAALFRLVNACRDYRAMHDAKGGDAIETGRAWDQMRRAEEAALGVARSGRVASVKPGAEEEPAEAGERGPA